MHYSGKLSRLLPEHGNLSHMLPLNDLSPTLSVTGNLSPLLSVNGNLSYLSLDNDIFDSSPPRKLNLQTKSEFLSTFNESTFTVAQQQLIQPKDISSFSSTLSVAQQHAKSSKKSHRKKTIDEHNGFIVIKSTNNVYFNLSGCSATVK